MIASFFGDNNQQQKNLDIHRNIIVSADANDSDNDNKKALFMWNGQDSR